MNTLRQSLIRCWDAGINAVRGDNAVRQALQDDGCEGISHLLAVGKAASSMCRGALPSLSYGGQVLMITKDDHVDGVLRENPNISIIGNHPKLR